MNDDGDADGAGEAGDGTAGAPSREVTHEATGPLKLDESDLDSEKGDIAVCLCGLSDDRPFCDGSHRATDGEERGGRYKYVDGERRRIDRIEYRDGSGGKTREE